MPLGLLEGTKITRIFRKMLFFTLILQLTSTVETNPSCKNIPGIGSPVNIFHSFFQNFLGSMSPDKGNSGVELVLLNEQNIENLVYRFIFKYTNTRNRTYYVGILSTIPEDQFEEPNPEHMIVRFIQSSDVQDAQRLLGLYNFDEKISNECEYKDKFWDYVKNNPFRLQRHITRTSQRPNKKLKESVENDTAIQTVKNYSNSSNNIQALTDLLSSLNSENSNTNITTNYRVFKTSSFDKNDPLKALLMSASLPKNSNKKIPISQENSVNLGNMLPDDDLNFLINNQNPFITQLNESSHNDNRIHLKNDNKKPIQNQQVAQNNDNIKYSNQVRYTLGSVLSGTGRDKIMNPQVANNEN